MTVTAVTVPDPGRGPGLRHGIVTSHGTCRSRAYSGYVFQLLGGNLTYSTAVGARQRVGRLHSPTALSESAHRRYSTQTAAAARARLRDSDTDDHDGTGLGAAGTVLPMIGVDRRRALTRQPPPGQRCRQRPGGGRTRPPLRRPVLMTRSGSIRSSGSSAIAKTAGGGPAE